MANASESEHTTVRVATIVILALCVFVLTAWGQTTSYTSNGSGTAHSSRSHQRRSFVGAASSAGKNTSPILTFTPGITGTVAGTGVSGYSGDSGPATSAQFASPVGIVRDSQGNIYIADTANNVVRKLSADGTVSTVAGTGTQGYSGDGGPATSAQLAFPTAVALDGAGNLFIADYFNLCLRKVDADGRISTPLYAAGIPVRGVAADSAGNVYFSSFYEGVWKADVQGVTTKIAGNGTAGFSGDGGPATQAQTSGVAGLTVDEQGNLYFAEVNNSDIRRVSISGVITTVAGNQQFGFSGDGGPAVNAKLNGPNDVHVDAGGNIYIADSSNNRIRKVNAAGAISTIVGDGNYGYAGDGQLASATQLAGPIGLAIDGRGNLFVADTGNNVIREINVETTTLDFGSITAGQTSSPIPVIVSNAGNSSLNLGSIVISAGFEEQTTCSTVTALAPGSECELDPYFAPAGGSAVTGTVTLGDNAPGNPHLIKLKGLGLVNQDFVIATSKTSLSVGNRSTGALNVNITPSGGFNRAITFACSGLPANSTCAFSPLSVQPDGSNTPLTSTLTLSVGLANSASGPAADGGVYLAIAGGIGIGLFGLVFAPRVQRSPDTRIAHSQWVQLILLAVFLCGGLVGCGSLGGQVHVTPPGTYAITVTGTSTTVSHGTSFTLVVQ